MIASPLQQKLMASSDLVEVGRYTYGTPKFLHFPSSMKTIIGSFCSIADEVTFITGGEHFTGRLTTYPLAALFTDLELPWLERSKGRITVGNDVWIGYGATILSGVTIGDGAVIGAGAVVANDVPPYAIVVGNPGNVLRYRFNESTISNLLEIQWWNWSLDKIKANALYLSTFNPEDIK